MIATQQQAREIIAANYGQEFADSVRFVKRQGITILMWPSHAVKFDRPTLCWRMLESGPGATIWLGRYIGYDRDGATFYDWEWVPNTSWVDRMETSHASP